MKKIKCIDLFAGIGGFHKALQITAKNNNFQSECVFVSEIDKEAIKTYSENFNISTENIINIRDLDDTASTVPDHDVLFAGFPCQAFSNAGNKKGFLDKIRGTLFFDIVKILKYKKPKYILLENVKYLVRHNGGRTWEIITKTLTEELGYAIPEKPLIASPHNFAIPQERQRVFIPGVLKKKLKKPADFININLDKYNDDILKNKDFKIVKKYIYDNFLEKKVHDKYFLNKKNDAYMLHVFSAWNEFLKKVKKPHNRTLPVIWANEFGLDYKLENMSNWRKKYLTDMRDIYKNNKEFIDEWMIKYDVKNWKKREQKFEWQAGRDINDIRDSFIQLRQSGIRCRKPIKFPTLVAMVQIPIIYDHNNKKYRYLTPRETANLQSFPMDFKTYSDINPQNKDFYSYKQFGNSVNVKLVSLIQEELFNNY